MVTPASVGPMKPEIEKPSASRLKLSLRVGAPPMTPAAFCTARWKAMKPRPMVTLAR